MTAQRPFGQSPSQEINNQANASHLLEIIDIEEAMNLRGHLDQPLLHHAHLVLTVAPLVAEEQVKLAQQICEEDAGTPDAMSKLESVIHLLRIEVIKNSSTRDVTANFVQYELSAALEKMDKEVQLVRRRVGLQAKDTVLISNTKKGRHFRGQTRGNVVASCGQCISVHR